MKKIEDMTDQEIYDLTDEEVDKIVKMAYMEAGLRFMDEPPVMELREVRPVTPGVFFYLIEPLNIAVCDEKDALKIMKFMENFNLYNTRYDFSLSVDRIDKKIGMYKVKPIPRYDNKDLDLYKNIERENSEIKKSHEERMSAYKENLKAMHSVYNDIIGTIWVTKRKIGDWMDKRSIFIGEYLPLADNDMDKAMAFFKKAYPVDEDMERFIKEGVKDYPLFNNKLD